MSTCIRCNDWQVDPQPGRVPSCVRKGGFCHGFGYGCDCTRCLEREQRERAAVDREIEEQRAELPTKEEAVEHALAVADLWDMPLVVKEYLQEMTQQKGV